MTTVLILAALAATLGNPARLAAADGADARRACLSAADTRENVSAHQLREPMALLREMAVQTRAEPLTARLCRWNEQFVYEMSLLRRDGRVVRVFVDAASGARVNARAKQER
jgi:hypothetical protein